MYIVTGGAGFLGSALIWEMNRQGISDILVVDNLASTEKWKNLVDRNYMTYLHRDEFLELVQDDLLEERLALEFTPGAAAKGGMRIEGIVHLGACSATTERDADFLMHNNLLYSKVLCDFALRRGARFIQASSAATYGEGEFGFNDDDNLIENLRPLNMYGYSKQLFDLWAKKTGRLSQIASLKFFNVYGPNEYHKGDMRSVIHKAVEQIHTDGKVRLFKSYRPEYSDGGQQRDFVYAKDCAAIMLWLLRNPQVNGIYNVGAGVSRSWNDLATAVFAAMGKPVNIEYIEMPEALRGKYQYFTEANINKLKAAGCIDEYGEKTTEGIQMHSLEDGVKDYVQNYLLMEYPYLAG